MPQEANGSETFLVQANLTCTHEEHDDHASLQALATTDDAGGTQVGGWGAPGCRPRERSVQRSPRPAPGNPACLLPCLACLQVALEWVALAVDPSHWQVYECLDPFCADCFVSFNASEAVENELVCEECHEGYSLSTEGPFNLCRPAAPTASGAAPAAGPGAGAVRRALRAAASPPAACLSGQFLAPSGACQNCTRPGCLTCRACAAGSPGCDDGQVG